MEHINSQATTQSASRNRYVGPSAARIAELIAPEQRVRFERGWFWTEAVCHDTEQGQVQDLMAFRQRPDGDGIDVRCHRVGARGRRSAGCSRKRIIRSLEQLTGASIWSAYTTEPRASALRSASAQASADKTGGTDKTAGTDRTGGRSLRLAVVPLIVLLLAAPLVLGHDLQVAALNAVGIVWVGWLGRRTLVSWRRAAAKGGRPS